MRDFYVDALLKSFKTTRDAVEITKHLQELLTRGGFKLTKFMSNAREVLGAFRPEDRPPTVKNIFLAETYKDRKTEQHCRTRQLV